MGKHQGTSEAPARQTRISVDSATDFLRSRKALPLRIGLLILWLVAFAFGGMAQGKISTVAESDPSFFLPASAESTLAGQEAEKFRDDSTIPALIVVANPDGEKIPEASIGILGAIAKELPDVQVTEGLTVSDLAQDPIPVIPNEDMTAVLLPLNLDQDLVNERDADDKKILNDAVDSIQQNLTSLLSDRGVESEDLTVYVSGPAGLSADLGGAFAGIDLTLLLVAVVLVFVILIVVYRSFLIPIAVLLTSVAALCAAVLVVFQIAMAGWLDLNGQTQGILAILVIGATTDYCLLLIARYREELTVVEHPTEALVRAIKGSWEPIVASGGTVIAGLLTLLISDLSSTSSLGPIASIGIVFAMLAALTLLPGTLLIPGKYARIMFWPAKIPHYSSVDEAQTHGFWHRIGSFVARHYRVVWVATLAILLVFSGFAFSFRASGTSAIEQFTKPSQAVNGFKILQKEFSAGSAQPTTVIVDENRARLARTVITDLPGVKAVVAQMDEEKQNNASAQGRPAGGPPAGTAEKRPGAPAVVYDPLVVDGRVLLNVTTEMSAEDKAAQSVVRDIRKKLEPLEAHALVGGPAAQSLDTQETAHHDFLKIVPVVLGVIAILLMILLRSVVAPLLVVVANVISFGATLGICAIVFNRILEFPGADASVPLYAFVFLIALGIDYTIFLMSRAREESLKDGTRTGIIWAIGVTGGVITSAGIVLASTFAALGVVPLLFMLQLAIIVSLGIIIDTFIVRSLLIPGMIYDVGRIVWWPWTLRKIPAKNS
ncbi:MMPL family transporter [Arcanobacterium phocae]|uniref:MMPL family transporter n=1 Tax=Arcanobacterium phocae TaxID=131112 RepID=UPI001C127EC2|nr:MMPL family transporter [Arcanobacterium phocae]